jgi:DNA-binding transcriptional ArsR family regulator
MIAVLDDDRLDQTFAALSNSTRRKMLQRLSKGAATVSELAVPFEMSMPAISKHVRVLEQAGLIRQSRQAQYRPCTIQAAPLNEVVEWTEQYRHIWETSFDRLHNYINEIEQAKEDK